MADVETKVPEEEVKKVAETTTEQTEEQKGENQEKKHKFESKWEIIDKIKSSDDQNVVLNIFKVHPEATWKEIKDVYREFHMKIDKVPNKEGMFNLYFRNHIEAINFIKVSPKPIMDRKFLIRINDRIKKVEQDGWNEMGADGHTSKHETMKYYKNKEKNFKKNLNKKTEEGAEHVEGAEEKTGEEGLQLPTRTIASKTEKPAEEGAATEETQQPSHQNAYHRTRKISNEGKGPKTTGESKRFIGESTNKPAFTNKAKNHEAKEEKPVVAAEKKADEWNTVKDPVKEKKDAEEARKRTEKIQKEKEAEEKKKEDAKKATVTKTVNAKKAADFTDGW